MGTILICSLLLVGCGKRNHNHTSKINVVSSVNFYGQTAQAVLGSHGTVNSIINNVNIDPHDFQPTPETAKAVDDANVIIGNGMGYDTWLDSLVGTNNNDAQYIQVSKLLHKKNTDNPHLWYNQTTMPKLAIALAKEFAQKDPAHKKDFMTNAQKYIHSLKPIQAAIDHQKRISNHQKVAVSEPVFDYALAAMGYQISDPDFAKSIENGTDPSPGAITNLQKSIVNHKIKFFVLNSQTSDRIVQNMVQLAAKHRIPVIKVTETMPNNQKTYQDWMLNQYQQLAKIKS